MNADDVTIDEVQIVGEHHSATARRLRFAGEIEPRKFPVSRVFFDQIIIGDMIDWNGPSIDGKLIGQVGFRPKGALPTDRSWIFERSGDIFRFTDTLLNRPLAEASGLMQFDGRDEEWWRRWAALVAELESAGGVYLIG